MNPSGLTKGRDSMLQKQQIIQRVVIQDAVDPQVNREQSTVEDSGPSKFEMVCTVLGKLFGAIQAHHERQMQRNNNWGGGWNNNNWGWGSNGNQRWGQDWNRNNGWNNNGWNNNGWGNHGGCNWGRW